MPHGHATALENVQFPHRHQLSSKLGGYSCLPTAIHLPNAPASAALCPADIPPWTAATTSSSCLKVRPSWPSG
eukprot:6421653-Heterocapsa_arctica.AAC.1